MAVNQNKKHTNHAYILNGWKRNATNGNTSSLFEAEAFYNNPEDYKLALHFAMMVDSAHDLLDRKYAIHNVLLFKDGDFRGPGWDEMFRTMAITKFTKTMYALLDLYGYGPDNPDDRKKMADVIKRYNLLQDVKVGGQKSAAPPATTIDGARMRMMGHINDIFLTPAAPVPNNKNKNIARQRGGYAARMMGRAELQQFILARVFAVDAGFAPDTHHLLGMTLAPGSKNARNVWLTSAIRDKKLNGWSQLTNSASTTTRNVAIPPQSVNNTTVITVPDDIREYLNYMGSGPIKMTPISQSTQLFGKITKYVQSDVASSGEFKTQGPGSFMLYRTKEIDVYVTTTNGTRASNNESFRFSMNDPGNKNRRIYVIDTGSKFKGPSMDSLMQVAVDADVQNNTNRRAGFIAACLDIKRDGDMGQMEANANENEIRMQNNEKPIFLLTGDITAMILGVMKGASTILVMSEGTYLMYCPLAIEYKTHYVTYRKMVDKSKEFLKYYGCPGGNNLIGTFLGGVLNSVKAEGRKSSIYSASRFINKLNNVGPFLTSNSQNLSTKWKALNNTPEVTAFKQYFTYALEMPSSALYTAAAELINMPGGKNSICAGYIRPTTTPGPSAVKNTTIPKALAVKRNNAKKKNQNKKIVGTEGVKTRARAARNAQEARNARAEENARKAAAAQRGMTTRAQAKAAENARMRNAAPNGKKRKLF